MSASPPPDAVRAADDPLRAVLRRALRELVVATVVIGVVGTVVGGVLDGLAGVLGALLGIGVGILFCGTTVASMLVTVHKPLTVLAAVILGAWLVKMIIIVAVLALIQDLDFYNRYVFAAVLLALALTSIAIDVRAVVQGRIPHAEAPPRTWGA
jgi:hypothetical protein